MGKHPTPRLYVAVFLILLGLLGLTVWAAHMQWGRFNAVVAVGIAAVKAALVAMFFMHLRYATPRTWPFAAAGLLWLGILFTLTFSDYLTRGWTSREAQITQPTIAPPPGLPDAGPTKNPPAEAMRYERRR